MRRHGVSAVTPTTVALDREGGKRQLLSTFRCVSLWAVIPATGALHISACQLAWSQCVMMFVGAPCHKGYSACHRLGCHKGGGACHQGLCRMGVMHVRGASWPKGVVHVTVVSWPKGGSACHGALLVTRGVVHVTGVLLVAIW